MYKILISFIAGSITGSTLSYCYQLPNSEIFNILLGAIISIAVSWWYNKKTSEELDIRIKKLEDLVTRTTNQIKVKQQYGHDAEHTIIDGKLTTTIKMQGVASRNSKTTFQPDDLEKGQKTNL